MLCLEQLRWFRCAGQNFKGIDILIGRVYILYALYYTHIPCLLPDSANPEKTAYSMSFAIYMTYVATTIATHPCQCSVTDDEHLDHAMVCKPTAGMATLRHDIRTSAWRRAGCATCAEPSYSNVLAPG